MALWVQGNSGSVGSVTWYKGDEIEYDANYLWPFNQKGTHKGYEEIRSSSQPLYIQFSSNANTNLLGVVLSVYGASSGTDYDRDLTVELEESTDGGSTWTSVRSKTIYYPDDISAGPTKQYGKYIIDFRFSSAYPVNTSNLYRFKVYRGNGIGSLYLEFSKNASRSSWTADVSDYAFRIIYSDTTGTPSSSDVFVVTDELVLDQDWTAGYITIPTSPAKDRLDSYNNKPSIWLTSLGRLYVPSSITSDVTIEVQGRIYISAGDRVAWQIGDSATNPIPSSRKVNWYFNCGGTSRRAGLYSYRSAWAKIEHYGAEITDWYAVLKEDAASGSNQIIVEGDVTSEWAAGDELCIGGTQYSSTRHYNDFQRDHHYYTISSLSYDAGNDETTITLTSTLSRMKAAGGRVLLLRRNVHIYGNSTSSTSSRATVYLYYLRWWRSYWTRYSYMYYPAYFQGYNPKISLADYPHTDIFEGVLQDNCHYFYIRERKGGEARKIATCDSKTSGWSWGDDAWVFYKCKDFTISDFIGITPYQAIQFSQSNNNTFSNFWINGQYGLYFYLSSGNTAYDGVIFNNRFGIYFSGASNNEVYNVEMKNIYYDSNSSPTTTSVQGCFYYAGDIISQDNYVHDISIENGFALFAIDIDDGATDWYDNITFTNITTEIYELYRDDWLDATRIRFTKKNGIENNDWIIFKYGEVHKTGNYTSSDDTLYRTSMGGQFALRLEPKSTTETFEEYRILLTGAKTGKPVSYVGYLYVKSEYFDGSNYQEPEIYFDGCGIDYTTEPSAKWTHPGSSYADTWVSFTIVGTPIEDGNVYVVIKLQSDGSDPKVYIDDDIYTWPESIDWRGHEVWIEGQPSYPPAKFPVLTAMEIWEQPTITLTASGTIGKLLVDTSDDVTDHRNAVEPNIDATISSRASQASVDAIPTNPLLDNDSRLDNLDAAISSRSSHSPADVWNYSDRELTDPDAYKADVSALALESTAQSIKSQTDKMQFDGSNNIQARVNDKGVLNDISQTEVTEAVWDASKSAHTSPDSFGEEIQSHATPSEVKAQVDQALVDYNAASKADITQTENNIRGADGDTLKTLSDQVDAVQSQTDKMQFTPDNDIKATLEGEEVTLSTDTEQQIDNIESDIQTHRSTVEPQIDTLIALTQRILGLSQENYRLFDIQYQSGKLTSATIKIYSSASDCENDDNPIAEYEVTASYSGTQLTSYKVVKV